jgi:hypothetical protein
VAVAHAAKKKSKIILAPAEQGANLIWFWGEQKPVSTLVETGFNFFSDFFAPASFLVRRNKKSSFCKPIAEP